MTGFNEFRHLVKTDFDTACDWAETNIPGVHDYLETWGPNCGAPREVFRGHLVKLLAGLKGTESGQ